MCVCVCVWTSVTKRTQGFFNNLAHQLIEVETGKRTCSGRHGHISAACGHQHHVVQSVTMHVHVILA